MITVIKNNSSDISATEPNVSPVMPPKFLFENHTTTIEKVYNTGKAGTNADNWKGGSRVLLLIMKADANNIKTNNVAINNSLIPVCSMNILPNPSRLADFVWKIAITMAHREKTGIKKSDK